MDDYSPPLSPGIDFDFLGEVYAPPLSPSIVFNFGVDGGGSENSYRRSNFMIFLTM